MSNSSQKTRRMVITAIMLAVAAVLSMIKVVQMPLGGSVTLLSMLPIALVSIMYGKRWGFVTAFLYSLIQLFLDLGAVMGWGLSPIVLIGCILFDYLLAYTALGISGLFSNKGVKGICLGVFLALLTRFVCHFISGVLLFSSWCPEGWNCAVYSICYNGAYMLPEMVCTMIGSSVLFKLPQFQKLMLSENKKTTVG